MSGSGERVCYIINDLLNRELIKQNFRFKQPIIPEDDEGFEESKDEDIGIDINTNQQSIDTTQLSLREYFKYCDTLGIEDEINKNPNKEKAFEEDENDIINPSVDPEEWYKEYNRVIKYIDKEIDSHGKIHISQEGSKKNLVDINYIDDLLERIENINGYFKVISDFLTGEGK